MTDNRTDIIRLAREFGSQMQATLTRREFREMIERNKVDDNPLVCHSHDFCDANEIMAAAFLAVFGREIDLENHAEVDLWNRAWDMAKEAGFYE